MLKKLPSRSHKVKGFKVKHAVKIRLLLVICIWLVYRLNHSHGEEALELSSAEKISGVTQNEHGVLVLGRRGLHPRVKEAPVDVERHRETEEEPEDEVDETKAEESEDGGIGLDEVDEHDHNTSDEDSEGVEDMINVDDTEREVEEEEENAEHESEEKENDSDDQVSIKDESYSQEVREEKYKGDDASSALRRNIRTTSNLIEVGSLKRMKEEEEVSLENFVLQKGNKAAAERGNTFDSVKTDSQAYAGSLTNTSEKAKMVHWLSLGNRYANQVQL